MYMDNERNRIIHRQEFLVRIRWHAKKDRKAMPSPNSWRSSGLEDKLQSKTWTIVADSAIVLCGQGRLALLIDA